MTAYDLTAKETMADDAVANLVSDSYKADEAFVAWVRILVEPFQDAEDLAQAMLAMLDIDTATGVWLDMLGRIVGQERTSVDDEVFRLSVKARVRINISSGTLRDLQELALLLFTTEDWSITDVYPNSCRVSVNSLAAQAPLLKALFQECIGAARDIQFVYSARPRADLFTFRHVDNPSSGRIGGYFASKV